MDFSRGALIPIENPRLALGQIVTYEDRANPRNEAAVISSEFDGHGQRVQFLHDGHTSTVSDPGTDGHGGWQMGNRVLNTDDLVQWIKTADENKARLAAEQQHAATVAATAREILRAQYLGEFGKLLDVVKPGEYASHSIGSRNLKRELTRAFPGIKFSVKSDSYSGGSSIDVSWELGPTTEAVKAISDKYQTADFNGMEDIEEYRHALWPEIFGGAKYVSETRDDGAAVNVVALALCARWKITPPADGKSFFNLYLNDDHRGGSDIGCTARQILFAQSYPAGAIITGIENTGEPAGQWKDILRATYTAPSPVGQPCGAAPLPAAQSALPAGNSITVKHNADKNGVEIHFPGKPAAAVLTDLKSNGWHWSRFNACWYAPRNSGSVTYAARLAGLTDAQTAQIFGSVAATGPDRFDMQVEDNMREACGL